MADTVLGPQQPLDLAPIEARLEHVTDGPWAYEAGGEDSWCFGLVDPPMTGEIEDEYDEKTSTFAEKPMVVDGVGEVRDRYDAAFVAHARTDVPALVAEVKRLRALVTEAAGALHLIALDPGSDHARDTVARVGRMCLRG